MPLGDNYGKHQNIITMTLIKSISGIRGTIGGTPGEALTPVDIVKFTYAYCVKLRERRPKPAGERYRVVVGKDARISGAMVEQLVCGTLMACGVDVIKAGFASTPTTEMAVIFEKADGGIILTASHNPKQWNALKLLNEKGEFLNAEEGAAILECAEKEDFDFAVWDHAFASAKAAYPTYKSVKLGTGSLEVASDPSSYLRKTDKLTFNKQTGNITAIARHADAPASQTLKSWFYAFHTGSWGGPWTQTLYFLAAVIGGILPLSGYYLWYKRTRAARKGNSSHSGGFNTNGKMN